MRLLTFAGIKVMAMSLVGYGSVLFFSLRCCVGSRFHRRLRYFLRARSTLDCIDHVLGVHSDIYFMAEGGEEFVLIGCTAVPQTGTGATTPTKIVIDNGGSWPCLFDTTCGFILL